jgi:ABC-type polysaccharide/polyol phosphate export permease
MLYFLSGVFFSIERLQPEYWIYFKMNPLSTILMAYRDCLMYARWPDFEILSIIGVGSIVLIAIGYGILEKYDKLYPKMVIS